MISVALLAHRLSSLHNPKDERVFDSVIVVTDRLVLDQQLQNTIDQFDHKQGVVLKIDEDFRQTLWPFLLFSVIVSGRLPLISR